MEPEASAILGRSGSLFVSDIANNEYEMESIIKRSKFLIIGAAGSIGKEVTKQILKRNPKAIHLVDISENNLVELVRDIRSSIKSISEDFRTFALDCGSIEFEFLINEKGPYDFFFNLSALKHVRSEKDPFTLMRLIMVNIINSSKILEMAKGCKAKNYFSVSSDKAANPVNMMGASKKIMEMFLMQNSEAQKVSTARFANVAFSDGSLLHGFNQRLLKRQPLAAPKDIMRYFITPEESGQLCLMASLLGDNRDIFFPKLEQELDLIGFPEITIKFLQEKGYTPYECSNEREAKDCAENLINKGKWPVYFFDSDTTGEKGFEEFYTKDEEIDCSRFQSICVIQNKFQNNRKILANFMEEIFQIRSQGNWEKKDIVRLFSKVLPSFKHEEKNKSLDEKM